MRIIDSVALKLKKVPLRVNPFRRKTHEVLDKDDISLGDRKNMAFMGTSVTYGRATGVVIATGMETQMGTIANQLVNTQTEITPLQQKLNHISRLLSIGVLLIAALIFAIGLSMGNQPLNMFLTAVSLAVAAIPEGLVAVVTIVLALGMTRMAKRGAIIRRLPAVETLGSTQIICSDKTGTLTQNRMTVQKIWTLDEDLLNEALGHCNDSKLDENMNPIGDPTETALIDYVLEKGFWSPEEIHNRKRIGEIPFDSQRKLSSVAVSHPSGKALRIFVKGAPDVLLNRCLSEQQLDEKGNLTTIALTTERLQKIEKANNEMARQALRVLAFAYKEVEVADFSNPNDIENGLTFIGLVGMIDQLDLK